MPTRAYEPADLRSWLSAGDAVTLLEIARGCLYCSTASDFRGLFLKVRELLPFQHACAISGRCDPRHGVVLARCLNVSFPGEFIREYVSRRYLEVDPLLTGALAAGRLQYCSEATPGRPKEIAALCMDFGITDGYIHAARPLRPGEDGSLFFFKSRSMKYDGRSAAILELLAPHLQLAFSRVVDGGCAAAVALSSREREVMRWLEEGKSSWDTAVILGISERTVNFHVQNILRKLGATNRAQAIAVAARLRLLG